MEIKKLIILTLVMLFLNSCSSNPYNISEDDAQVILNIDTGEIIDIVPVKIKGNPSEIAATIGGLIGGIAGKDVGSGKGQEIAVIVGSTIGGVTTSS